MNRNYTISRNYDTDQYEVTTGGKVIGGYESHSAAYAAMADRFKTPVHTTNYTIDYRPGHGDYAVAIDHQAIMLFETVGAAARLMDGTDYESLPDDAPGGDDELTGPYARSSHGTI